MRPYNYIECEKFESLLQVGSNTAFVTTRDIEDICRFQLNGSFPWKILNEKIISDPVGFYFGPNDFFYEIFNQKTVQLFESGIARRIVHFSKKAFRVLYNSNSYYLEKVTGKVIEKVPISMTHIAPWFYLFLILISVSFVAFIVEIILKPRRKTKIVSKRRRKRKR
jgi:hypothetical protein